LIEICNANGVGKDKDYPEPQNEDFYRRMGNWAYLDELKPYADYPLRRGRLLKSMDELDAVWQAGGSAFQCSGIAIKKVVEHRDGFAIHDQDPANAWAHNMRLGGKLVASDGEPFGRLVNESWGPDKVYNIRYTTIEKWFRQGKITVASIDELDGPKLAPPVVA
jgi:hypothetical protein